jgi:hypothetical protein
MASYPEGGDASIERISLQYPSHGRIVWTISQLDASQFSVSRSLAARACAKRIMVRLAFAEAATPRDKDHHTPIH